jgi:hypothetical protein
MPDLCPTCQTVMTPDPANAASLRCEVCAARTAAAPGEASQQLETSGQSSVLKQLLFGLSLPERVVRSGVGLAAGIVQESASLLVPQAFQSSKSYEISITNSLKFLTETIGGVKREAAEGENDAAEFVARKAVGNFVDLASLATLHLSPMWILAIASDVAYGSKTFVKELAGELKQQGLIDDTSSINNVDDFLSSLQNVAGKAASNLDTPPFSIEGLKSVVAETRDSISQTDLRKLIPQNEMQRYWQEMREIAAKENVSLLQVSGAITMQTLGTVKTVSQGALTGVRVAGGLLNRNVLQHYVRSLSEVHARGYYATLQDSSKPYLQAVWDNFSSSKESWTENLLNPTNIQSRIGKAWSWMTGRKPAAGGANQESGVSNQESGNPDATLPASE